MMPLPQLLYCRLFSASCNTRATGGKRGYVLDMPPCALKRRYGLPGGLGAIVLHEGH